MDSETAADGYEVAAGWVIPHDGTAYYDQTARTGSLLATLGLSTFPL